jgi:NAD(P)-dependent dehydrogenase (short-subunit alcohol dehydrogenase family)
MGAFARVVDRVLEASVAGSFTRLGPLLRSRLEGWTPLEGRELAGRTFAVTGATSGLGLALAEALARAGASVVVLARDSERGRLACERIGRSTGVVPDFVEADLGDLASVRRAATELLSRHPALHGLVHNAGALDDVRRESPQGIEQTVACHVVGPYLLTELLRPALARAAPSRVVFVSSGGMYAEPLDVGALEMPADRYDGVRAYARAKRAQVTLAQLLAERLAPQGIVVQAMHPGWVDTPGVARSLPRFRRLTRPLLRDVAEGIDTLLWLLLEDAPMREPGGFWLDRARRPIHRLASTRRADTPAERARLLSWVAERAALGG